MWLSFFYYLHTYLVEKTDIKFGQQLRKGEYENEQSIGKEVEQVMVPTAYTAFNQMDMFV